MAIPDAFGLDEETTARRAARLEDIRFRIGLGKYEVPSQDVADAVFAFFSRDIEPIRGRGDAIDTGSTGEAC